MTTTSNDTIRVGVIGLGFIGQVHLNACAAAQSDGYDVELTAVCDKSEQRRRGEASVSGNIDAGQAGKKRLFDPDRVCAYEDADEMFADPNVDLVSICTHTDTHVNLALKALEANKHVLIEKPVATSSVEAQRVADAARRSDRVCMPAMCMRFWPGWDWLKERIDDGSFGRVRSAVFRRLGSRPGWGGDFYANDERSGGALFDLHIHDADFIRWVFGEPERVSSAGSLHHITTMYHFANGPEHVVAEGGWDHSPGFGFQMRYIVVFDDATVEFDLGAESKLTLARAGEKQVIALDPRAGYDFQIRHVLDAIRSGDRQLRATIADAVADARLLEAERRSLETGAAVQLH